ncbi:hypothetical protein GCM10008955_38200 [Deinococcus malanensis]|uniref:Uncharacterized protein n=1 Tax=Deinococcus malanensis TaxID=1706855 RepID=A0ABQ2F1A3_9DEIO|nr:hypothetical protein GCM10008955_38200 [Deinococcus malanensis]
MIVGAVTKAGMRFVDALSKGDKDDVIGQLGIMRTTVSESRNILKEARLNKSGAVGLSILGLYGENPHRDHSNNQCSNSSCESITAEWEPAVGCEQGLTVRRCP